jgi:GT2 family glycosyltransferase
VFLEPGAVEKMKAALLPEVGMVCHLLRFPSGKIYPVAMGRKPGDRDWHHVDNRAWHPSIHEVTELENCCGASVLVRRTAFYEIGGFDEDIFCYTEDNAFALAIRKAGWRILYLPHVSGVHINGESTKKLGVPQNELIAASSKIFHAKWGQYIAANINTVPGTFAYLNE